VNYLHKTEDIRPVLDNGMRSVVEEVMKQLWSVLLTAVSVPAAKMVTLWSVLETADVSASDLALYKLTHSLTYSVLDVKTSLL